MPKTALLLAFALFSMLSSAGAFGQVCSWNGAHFNGETCPLVQKLQNGDVKFSGDDYVHRTNVVYVCQQIGGTMDEVKDRCMSPDHRDPRKRYFQTTDGYGCFARGEYVYVSPNEGARPMNLFGAQSGGTRCP